MSAKAIGIGVAALLLIVILFFAFSETINQPLLLLQNSPEAEVNDPPCSESEVKVLKQYGELGTTSQQCCQKPLCPIDICTANNVEFKDPIENARGDYLDECCEDFM